MLFDTHRKYKQPTAASKSVSLDAVCFIKLVYYYMNIINNFHVEHLSSIRTHLTFMFPCKLLSATSVYVNTRI